MEADRVKRTAHEIISPQASGDKPMILPTAKSKIPISIRQAAVEKLFDFLRAGAKEKEPGIKESLALEEQLYAKARQKSDYKNAFASLLLALKKGNGPSLNAKPAIKNLANLGLLRLEEVFGRLEEMLASRETLDAIGFPSVSKPSTIELLPDQEKTCCRCGRAFISEAYYRDDNRESCMYHYGRLQNVKGQTGKIYACCHGGLASAPCTTAPRHVFLTKGLFSGQQVWSSADWQVNSEHQHLLLAVDGEMCHTEAGLEICRLTAVGWDEERVLDVLIHPETPIVDYNTRFSGLTAASFEEGGFPSGVVPVGLPQQTFTLHQVMTEVLPLVMGPQTLLVGHSLENDLLKLRLDHPRILDTSILYPHNKGPPYRMALRDLSRVHLQQFLQEGSDGHDSYEDCIACLRLLKIKL
jgi:RNA exonuclease 1